jgi:ubiquinone/menaquinone biosynthesis C-methylase UbiE
VFSDPTKNLSQFDISPTQSVGDFGSGAGFYVLPLAKAVGDEGHVYAIDIQKELLSKIKTDAAREHLFNVDIIWADFEESQGLRLGDGVLDRGLITNTLFQIANKDGFIKEVNRVLRPTGKIMVIDWSDSFGGLGPDKKSLLSKEQCRKLLENGGFIFEKEIQAGAHHYGFIFKKG